MKITVIIAVFVILLIFCGGLSLTLNGKTINTRTEDYNFNPNDLQYKFKIDGNTQILKFLKMYNASGTGTKNDPYKIYNMKINLKGDIHEGLYIANTTIYVIFKNLRIYDSSTRAEIGVGILNSTHITFINSSINADFSTSDFMGFYILNSTYITVKNFEFRDMNGKNSGFWILNSSNITIKNGTIWNVNNIALLIKNSSHSLIYSITLIRGEIVIGFSTNITINFSNFYTHNNGILMVSDKYCIINNDKFIENYYGVWSIDSDQNIIYKNIFIYDNEGINMAGINTPTHDNIIKENLFAFDKKYGIYLNHDGSNWIYKNIFLNSSAYDGGYPKESPYWNYSYPSYSFWNSSEEGNYWRNNITSQNHENTTNYTYPIMGHAHAYDYHPLKNRPFNYTIFSSSPQNLKLIKKSGYEIIEWMPPKYLSSQIVGYNIYNNGKLIDSVSRDIHSYKIKEKYDKPTIYYVTAVNKNGEESMISNEILLNPSNKNTETIMWIISIATIILAFIIVLILIFKKKNRKNYEKA